MGLVLALGCVRETAVPSPPSDDPPSEVESPAPIVATPLVEVIVEDRCPNEVAQILGVIEGLEFDTGKWTIKRSSYPVLDHIAEVLRRHENFDIEIAGHVSADPSDPWQRARPSQRRADSVRDYLLHRGVDPQRLRAVGYGEDRPIDTNDTREGRARNRRIELIVVDPPWTGECVELPTVSEQASAEGCARCHAEVVEEWRGSAHANAWTDPLVAREYAAQPDPRCVGCHAPRTAAGEQPSGLAAHDGVDCLSCHAAADIHAPERALVSARESSEACGSCHQFRFWSAEHHDGPAYDTDAWLQDTLGEWSRSEAANANIGCVDCHMPEESHAFPGMSDPKLSASAVEVSLSARRAGETLIIDAQLRPGAIGHAFPTGDMFRAAVLRAWTDERSDEYVLKRWFAAAPVHDDADPVEVVEVADTRVHGEPLSIELRLRDPDARRVNWSLQLRAAGRDGPDPLERRVTIREGELAVAP